MKKRFKLFISLAVVFAVAFSMAGNAFAYSAGSTTPTYSKPWYGIVTGDDVMIRKGPSTSYDPYTKDGHNLTVSTNDLVHLISKTGNWYVVHLPEIDGGTTGYISASYITTDSTHNYLTVSAASTGLRISTNTSASAPATIYFAEAVPFYGTVYKANGTVWYASVYGLRTGYIISSDVSV